MHWHTRNHKHEKKTLGLGALLAVMAVGGAVAAYFLRAHRNEQNEEPYDHTEAITAEAMNRPDGTARTEGDTPGIDPLPRDAM